MKENTRKISLFMVLSIILFLSSSFISHEKEDSLKFINIEVLSQGEESPFPDCKFDTGFCITKTGIRYEGMTVAQQK